MSVLIHKKQPVLSYPDISALNQASSISDTDTFAINNGTTTKKIAALQLKEYTSPLYKVVLSGVSSLSSCRFPASGTNDKIKSTMEVTEAVLSNPAAQTGDWSVNFYDGYLTVTGNISGTTNITLKFQDCITLS